LVSALGLGWMSAMNWFTWPVLSSTKPTMEMWMEVDQLGDMNVALLPCCSRQWKRVLLTSVHRTGELALS
jgi:hypothetical protein